MKRLPFPAFAIVILALASCKQAAPVDTVGEQNKVLVKRYTDAVTSGDTASLTSFLADDFMAHGPAMKDSADRQKEVDNWKKNWAEEFKYTLVTVPLA